MTAATRAPWEPSEWMRAAVGRRLTEVDALVPDLDVQVLTKLKPSTLGEKSDRTCDRCGTYVPPGGAYGVELVVPPHRPHVGIIVGLCLPCGRREGWTK